MAASMLLNWLHLNKTHNLFCVAVSWHNMVMFLHNMARFLHNMTMLLHDMAMFLYKMAMFSRNIASYLYRVAGLTGRQRLRHISGVDHPLTVQQHRDGVFVVYNAQ